VTKFGKRFNMTDFQCSWITHFLPQKQNIIFGKMNEELVSVLVGILKNCLEHVWPNLPKNYAHCNI